MKRFCFTLSALLLVLGSKQAISQTGPAYYYLRDAKHNLAVVAGDTYDGRVYHQQPNGRENAQWRFESAGDGYYYILDRKHGRALVAGDVDDNNVYHQAANGRLNAQWKPIPAANGAYYFEDRKHKQVFVAGDVADGHVYHQAPLGRLNAQWKLELAVPGARPAFLAAASAVKFPRNEEYERRMCDALKIPVIFSNVTEPVVTSLGTLNLPASTEFLRAAIAPVGLEAAEIVFANESGLTPDQALDRIATQDSTRQETLGIIALLLRDRILKGQASTEARAWATQVFRGMKVKAAKGALDEYLIWKKDPCAYAAAGYEKPQSCYGRSVANLFAMVTPPTDLIGKAGLQAATSSENGIVAAVSTALTGVSMAAAAAATMSGLGVPVVTGGIATLTALYSAFGGSVGASVGGSVTAASIGATSWAGVVAAPVAATVFAVTIGVTQGLAVYEAAMVEPNLKKQLGAAMSEHINIANALADDSSASLFFVGFVNAAQNDGWNPPQVAIDGEVTFRCEAGYVSKFTLSYSLNGQNVTRTTRNLALNEEESIAIPKDARDIVAKGYMISAGEHPVFTQSIAAPTYTCFKTYNTIFNPSWANAWPLKPPNTVKLFHQGGYVAKYQIDYMLGGQPQRITIDNKTAGWTQTYSLPENATAIKIQGWGATGLIGDWWRLTFAKDYPEPPNVCIKTYGTTLNQQWSTDCN